MTFPDRLEIAPFPNDLPPQTVRVPGSKSITNRALVLAALTPSPGRSCRLEGVLHSEDTEVMVDALRRLGFEVQVDWDACRTEVRRPAGSARIPATSAELFVGNSGTTMRFLTAVVALGHGRYRLDGVPRAEVPTDLAMIQLMNRKPEAALLAINSSRTTLLPTAMTAERRLLEARAWMQLGQYDHAVEILGKDAGADAADIRGEIAWRQHAWPDAGKYPVPDAPYSATLRSVSLQDLKERDLLPLGIYKGTPQLEAKREWLDQNFYGTLAAKKVWQPEND